MPPLVSSLLAAADRVRPHRPAETCLSCGLPLRDSEARMRLPGGGHVHRRCATYRMRQNERVRRVLR